MPKTTTPLLVEDYYRTSLWADVSATWDIELTVTTPPSNTKWFIVITPESEANRERAYFHDVVGNTIYIKEENRINPKAHYENDLVQINDTSLVFNYLSKRSSTTFFVEQTWSLWVTVWGWPVMKNNIIQSIDDTNLTLVDDTTNYIYYDHSDNTIKSSISEASIAWIITSEVTTASWLITSISYRNYAFNVVNVAGLEFQGAYNNWTSYTQNNLVTYWASTYICLQDTLWNLPTDPVYWEVLVVTTWMSTFIYDPTNVAWDAFDRANHFWLVYLDKSSDIASATNIDLTTATGNLVHITWTTTIESLWTVQAWAEYTLIFDWILDLTHNWTSLILPTWADITTQSWDSAKFVSEWGWNWRCVSYLRADGTSLISATWYISFIWNAAEDLSWQEAVFYSKAIDTTYDIAWATTNPADYFPVRAQEDTPNDIFFKPDGLKMYIVWSTWDEVNEYDLSTAWDIKSATYSSTFSVSAKTTAPEWLFFWNSGTEMYVVNANTVHQYTLSTAWDITTATFTSSYASLQGTANFGVSFNDDGTKMYSISINTNLIYQYTLSTAWLASSASYDSVSFSVASESTSSWAIRFKDDGTKMWILDLTLDALFEYDLSTPYDVSTASYADITIDVTSDLADTEWFFIGNSWQSLYIVSSLWASERIRQWSIWLLLTEWFNLSNPLIEETTKFSGFVKSSASAWNPATIITDWVDWNHSWLTAWEDVFLHKVKNGWDLLNATDSGNTFVVTTQEATPYWMTFKDDGTKMYIVWTTNDTIYQYTLSTPYDVSTASYDSKSFSVSTQSASPVGIKFGDNWTKVYISDSVNDSIYQYDLSTAWDISTAWYSGNTINTTSQDSSLKNIFLKWDWTKLYTVWDSNNSIYQYTLSTAWDISSATYDSVSFSVASEDTSPQSLWFKPDGTKMYMWGGAWNDVNQYTLTTAWDISTAWFDWILKITLANSPTDLFITSDWLKFYVIWHSTDTVYEYDLGTYYTAIPWDIMQTPAWQDDLKIWQAFSTDSIKIEKAVSEFFGIESNSVTAWSIVLWNAEWYVTVKINWEDKKIPYYWV